jgi:hypothetical protein
VTTSVILTIDTEFVWRAAAGRWSDWQEIFARSYDPAGVGVPYQLEMLAYHGLKACFFVDPMPGTVFGIDAVKQMVGPILEAGQEVQLHIHPNWLGAADWRAETEFELVGLPEGRQRDLIDQARGLLVAAGAPAPIAFRAGSFAADDATLAAAASLGMRFDSSHNGGVTIGRITLPKEQIAPVAHGGLIEVPVTQIGEPGGGLRPLQLCAVSTREMRAALDHAEQQRHALVTIVSHSFELASRDSSRPNRTHQRRFDRLCAILAERRDTLPTAHFTDLRDLPLGAAETPLPPHGRRRAWRQAEQLWSNLYDERRL